MLRVNSLDHLCQTPLYLAVALGCHDIVQILLKAHANPNCLGFQPLELKPFESNAFGAHIRLSETLSNVSVDVKDGPCSLFAPYPLHSAAMQDTKMVQLLLDKDANTEVFYFNGLKPVHLAAKSGRADIVGILFKKPTEYVGPFQGVGANDMIPFFRQDYNILSKLANHNLCMIQACLRCADIFFECSFFTKALFLYNEAYARHVDPSHPKAIQTLIKRGQCWLGILNEGNALIDAEAAVNALMKTNRQDDECKFGC